MCARFQSAWESEERSKFWSLRRRLAVLERAAHFDGAAAWVLAQLESLIQIMPSLASDPHDLATSWLEVSKAQAAIGQVRAAISSIGAAARDGWGPGQHHDDNQLVDWLSWLIESAREGHVGTEEFLSDALVYADRLLRASRDAEVQAGEAAGTLIAAVFEVAPALACDLGEALCDSAVLKESDLVAAIARGAARTNEADVRVVESLVSKLLMKLIPSIPPDLEELVLTRCADPEDTRRRFGEAKALWEAADSRRERSGEGSHSAPDPLPGVPPIALTAVLRRMREVTQDDVTESEITLWTVSVDEAFDHPAPQAVVRAMLDEAERLGLGSHLIGRIAGLVSKAGAPERARTALSRVLATTTPYGWMRRWDGGSRVELFESAISGEDAELIDLAAQDLAGLVASKATAGEFSSHDLRRFLRLFGGEAMVAESWRDVRAYLDVFAPPAEESLAPERREGGTADDEMLRWLSRQLGHPVRIVDFGVRRILADAADHLPDAVDRLLSVKIAQGGWAAEAALHVLHRTRAGEGLPLSSLTPVLELASSSTDIVVRLLAQALLEADGQVVLPAPRRELTAVYDLEMPALPSRAPAEVNREGVPHLDMTDPQHVVAPFDFLLDGVAHEIGLDAATLIHHAATIARANDEPWTAGGLRSHAARLKARGNMHTYRPWAFMVGRRAVAEVLADLIDAGRLPSGADSPFVTCMIDYSLSWFEPSPLDATCPLPWRSPEGKDYASEEWCEEAPGAAQSYSEGLAGNALLAERSSWRWLDWLLPEEERWVRTFHGQLGSSSLIAPVNGPAWEETYDVASSYPRLNDLSWEGRQLVVFGRGMFSDPDHMHWLALHPAVGAALGWTPGERLFEWVGPDGNVRASTVYRVRGQLSHRPPSDATCGDVWQVVLSELGLAELADEFHPMTRRVSVKRILPESRRSRRPRMETSGTAFVSG